MNAEKRVEYHKKIALHREIYNKLLMLPLFVILFLFLPAGTFRYWEAYIYCMVLFVPMLYVMFYFLKKDPEFLERRLKTKEKEPQQRKIIFLTFIPYFSAFIIPGFDHRFGWSHVPFYFIIIANLLVLAGYIFIIFVFRENSFASRVVEVEKDQKVITTGPYRIIRHPMYLGVLVMMFPTPIALGSYWAVIPLVVLPLALILRILNEEKVLSEQLVGYNEYCLQTHYRLIPYIW